MPRIHIGFDFWGAGNCGDDLMLAGFTEWMSCNQKEWQISCLCAHDIHAMRNRFPVIEWYAADEVSRETALQKADIWLGLGGGVFQTDVGMWILDRMVLDLRAAAKRGIPSYLAGVGTNNTEALLTPQTQEIHRLAKHIWVRDRTCLEAMKEAGFEKVELGADTAHLCCCQQSPKLQGTAIALIADPIKVDLPLLGIALTHLKATWICQEVRDLFGSELHLYEKLPAHLKQQIPFRSINYNKASLDEVYNHMMSWSNVLTSRYHTILAAAWAGSCITVYERNTKLTAIRKELGLPECVNLAHAVEAFKEGKQVKRSTLLECKKRAELMLEELFQ